MTETRSNRPSRLQAHRNALLLSLAFTSFIVGVAYIPLAGAYTYSAGPEVYNRDVDAIYTDWGHTAWIELEAWGYSNGQHLDAADHGVDCGGASGVYTVVSTDHGITTIDEDERVAWGQFLCREWYYFWVVREEAPILNICIEYIGEGSFDFTLYTTY